MINSTPLKIAEAMNASADFKALLELAQQRTPMRDNSVMALILWLHQTWRDIEGLGAKAADDGSRQDQLRHELAMAVYCNPREPANFSHGRDPASLRGDYLALQACALLIESDSNQWGFGSVLTTLRYAAIAAVSGADGIMPREIPFAGTGIGFRDIPLVAVFPAASKSAHAGKVDIRFADVPGAPLASMPVQLVTGYRSAAPSIDALGRLHRFGRYGEGMVRFGNWFTADGEGRELLAAMIDGLANRVLPDVPNGIGGTSPQFALTSAGVEYVLAHPKLAGLFDHFNNIEAGTAWLVDGAQRVPFDTQSGAILGQLGTDPRHTPAYVTKSNLAGVAAGQEYKLSDLGYLLADNLERGRAQMVALEEKLASAPPLERYDEDEFDAVFGLVNGSRSDTCSYEYDEVKDMDPRYVWSLVEGGDDDGTAYALPGFHRVNNIGYTVTEKPWPHEHIEAVYMAGQEHTDDMRP